MDEPVSKLYQNDQSPRQPTRIWYRTELSHLFHPLDDPNRSLLSQRSHCSTGSPSRPQSGFGSFTGGHSLSAQKKLLSRYFLESQSDVMLVRNISHLPLMNLSRD